MRRCDRGRLRFWNLEAGPAPGDPAQPALRLAIIAAAGLLLAACAVERETSAADPACAPAGLWLEPASGRTVSGTAVLDQAAGARIVLLGEVHDDADCHRWQLQVLSTLHVRGGPLVIGVEMLLRRAQPALDQWVAGSLSETEFFEAVRWKETWGHNPALYLPLFRFARDRRIPMLALNVERSLVSKVARKGWRAVSADERQGVGEPAPPTEAYRRSLAAVFAEHAGGVQAGIGNGARFERFSQAQAGWDRAMAEAIAAASAARPGATMVGIVGKGHVEHGWGIPRQLADLGAPSPMVLLPAGEAEACTAAPDLADAVFVLPPGREGGR